MDSFSPPAPESIIQGGGQMGRLVREKNWAETPLGAIGSWPQSLRTTANLCLSSNFPISIVRGPERVQIYNDGYWPICGAKHPDSLGQVFRECWSAPWQVISPAFEQASQEKTAFLENSRMFLKRNGYLEETFFTFSFSSVRDESGAVGRLEFPKLAKADEHWRTTPVVVLTTSKLEYDRIATLDLSVAGYMVKPVNLQFVETIRVIDLYWTISETP